MHDAILSRIREAVLAGRYRFSDHALEELDNDRMTYVDAEAAVLTGVIVCVKPPDQDTAARYTVEGHASDFTTLLAVVCRFDIGEVMLIITAYQIR